MTNKTNKPTENIFDGKVMSLKPDICHICKGHDFYLTAWKSWACRKCTPDYETCYAKWLTEKHEVKK